MLASLLPGLREVRTPLAAGYLWLLNLWLVFRDRLPMKAPNQGLVVPGLFELGNLLGMTTILAGVSFAAYLLGSLIKIPVPGWLSAMLTTPRKRGGDAYLVGSLRGPSAYTGAIQTFARDVALSQQDQATAPLRYYAVLVEARKMLADNRNDFERGCSLPTKNYMASTTG